MTQQNKPWLSHYDSGVPVEIDIPNLSLVDLLQQAVQLFGKSTCIISNGTQQTYQQVDMLSNKMAHYLISKGIKRGDRVGLVLPNIPAFVISYFGILKVGAVVTALNPMFHLSEIKNIFLESAVRVVVLPGNLYRELKPIQEKLGIDSFIVVNQDDNDLSDDDISWEEINRQRKGDRPVPVNVTGDDPAVFQYSGGTTGTPKCAIGLHRNLVANVFQFHHWLINTELGKETILVAIPLYHVYGMVLGMILTIKMGARMVLISNPGDLDHLLGVVERFRASIFPGVPNLYAAINHYPPVLEGKFNLSSIKACISGSTTLPLAVKQEFEALTGGHLVEGYGLSEAPTATHCNPVLGENRIGSIGLPLPNVDCKIVDLENGEKEVDVDGVGELIIRGPQVMSGYYNQPKETEMTLRDGWLFTGDVVRMDRDGYFYIVDRKKDVIKVGGFQVWPNEIEAVISQHPKVREVAVAGVLDGEGNESAKAWIVLNKDKICTLEEIRSFCESHLTRYKIPRMIEFRESLPRTRVGKVLRRTLVAEHQPKIKK